MTITELISNEFDRIQNLLEGGYIPEQEFHKYWHKLADCVHVLAGRGAVLPEQLEACLQGDGGEDAL